MSIPPRDPERAFGPEINPYAAPESRLGEAPAVASSELAEAEAVRRAHLNHEASVKAIGSLHLFGAFVCVIGLVAVLAYGLSNRAMAPGAPGNSAALIGLTVYMLFLILINGTLGMGLRGLKTWARWLEVVLIGLSLLATFAGNLLAGAQQGGMAFALGVTFAQSIIPLYILYLMLSQKGTVVFSHEYKDVIALTPHIKYRSSWIVKGCLIVFVAIIAFAVLGGLLSWYLAPRAGPGR
jgi:hypothetical protein